MKHGFIYIWRDRKHHRYYIGSHWGRIDDGYICSSTWMRNSYNRRPHDFKRRVISYIYTNWRDTLIEEEKWLSKIKEDELGKRYYNHRRFTSYNHLDLNGCVSEEVRKRQGLGISQAQIGRKHSEETKEKISSSHKGKKLSEEVKKKISEGLKGKRHSNGLEGHKHSEETRRKMSISAKGKNVWMKGKQHSEETKRKIRIARAKQIMKPVSEETKRKISDARTKFICAQCESTLQCGGSLNNLNTPNEAPT